MEKKRETDVCEYTITSEGIKSRTPSSNRLQRTSRLYENVHLLSTTKLTHHIELDHYNKYSKKRGRINRTSELKTITTN